MDARIRCPVCEQFYRSERVRCPRCLAPRPEPGESPQNDAPQPVGRRGMAIAFTFVAAAGLATVWLLGRPASLAVATAAAARAATADVHRTDGYVPDDAAPVNRPRDGTARPFLEPMGAGRMAYDEGRTEDSLAAYRRALEADPGNVDAMNNVAQVLVRLGRAEEALPLLKHAAEAAPSRWDLHFNLARALGEAGQWQDAASAYRRAAALRPDDVYTAFNLAKALDKADDPSALTELERVTTLVPDEPSFHLTLAIAAQRRGEWDRSRQAFRRYRELLPVDSAEGLRVDRHLVALEARGAGATPPVADR